MFLYIWISSADIQILIEKHLAPIAIDILQMLISNNISSTDLYMP